MSESVALSPRLARGKRMERDVERDMWTLQVRERLDRETQRPSCVFYLPCSFSKPENDFTWCFSISDMDDRISAL